MKIYGVKYSRAQMKIQQMAFMLVAAMIFFAMVGMVYFSISLSNLKDKAIELQDKEARETVRKISGIPEFAFTSSGDCSSCIDFDKAMQMKDSNVYQNLWNFDYLMIERLDSNLKNVECTRANYPNCGKIILINKSSEIATKTAFVSVAFWDERLNWFRYDTGRVHASARSLGR